MADMPNPYRDRLVRMGDDPLSPFFDLIQARAVVSTALEARGLWAVDVPAVRALKCAVVKQGECLVEVQGGRWHFEAGDCFLVAPDLPFVIGSDLARMPTPAVDVFVGTGANAYARLDGGEGQEFLCLSGRMDLPPIATPLTDALPPISVIRNASAAAGRLHWLIARLQDEFASEMPGAAAMAAQIMQMIFIELIRNLPDKTSWLAALYDPQIGMALRAIHRDPGLPWKLEELAALSHLSRSQFSARFRAAVGQAPMKYVLHWRMALAQKALSQPNAKIAAIAARLGYGSESAFTHAFRRVNGTSPRKANQR